MLARTGRLLAFLTACPFAVWGQEDRSIPGRFGVTPTFGLTIGQPLGVSGSAALIIGSVPEKPVKCAFSYWSKGAFVQIEPGLGGGKGSLGWANGNGMFGMAVKGSVVRTWGKTWGTDRGATYLGPEAELAMFGRLRLGWLWRVGSSSGKRSMLTWGLGIGF